VVQPIRCPLPHTLDSFVRSETRCRDPRCCPFPSAPGGSGRRRARGGRRSVGFRLEGVRRSTSGGQQGARSGRQSPRLTSDEVTWRRPLTLLPPVPAGGGIRPCPGPRPCPGRNPRFAWEALGRRRRIRRLELHERGNSRSLPVSPGRAAPGVAVRALCYWHVLRGVRTNLRRPVKEEG
jgi:hypothetical protein